jgi:hypothetical protein
LYQGQPSAPVSAHHHHHLHLHHHHDNHLAHFQQRSASGSCVGSHAYAAVAERAGPAAAGLPRSRLLPLAFPDAALPRRLLLRATSDGKHQ